MTSTDPSPREALEPAQLYARLAEMFERARDPRCGNCAMPLPILRPPPDPYAANWHAGIARHCHYRCHVVIAEIQAELWLRYDMREFDAARPAEG